MYINLYTPRPHDAPLLRALWSLLDGIWAVLLGSWGVLMYVDNLSGTWRCSVLITWFKLSLSGVSLIWWGTWGRIPLL